jgi:hypothetical protein
MKAMFVPFTDKEKASLNTVLTNSSYSSEANTYDQEMAEVGATTLKLNWDIVPPPVALFELLGPGALVIKPEVRITPELSPMELDPSLKKPTEPPPGPRASVKEILPGTADQPGTRRASTS